MTMLSELRCNRGACRMDDRVKQPLNTTSYDTPRRESKALILIPRLSSICFFAASLSLSISLHHMESSTSRAANTARHHMCARNKLQLHQITFVRHSLPSHSQFLLTLSFLSSQAELSASSHLHKLSLVALPPGVILGADPDILLMSVRTISCLSLSCFLTHAAPPRHN